MNDVGNGLERVKTAPPVGAGAHLGWQSKIKNQKSRIRLRLGLGLAEMLIALVISALLLTAAAVALDASFKAYTVNQEQSALMQQTRIALHRMTGMIRECRAHAPVNSGPLASFSVGSTVTDHGIAMFDDNNNEITYQYDSANKRLLCLTGTTQHTMLEGVEQFDVSLEPMRSEAAVKAAGAYDLLRRATITMAVQTTADTAVTGESTGRQVVTLSAAVAPRRNAW
jgi:type II secretory pathway component PulJ